MAKPNKKSKKNVPAKVEAKRSPGRPKSSETAEDAPKKKGKKPIVILVNRKLHGMAKLVALSKGESLTAIVAEFLASFVEENKKALKKFFDSQEAMADEDEDEDTDSDSDDEDADEDEDEDSDDDNEDEDEDEDDDDDDEDEDE